MASTNKTTNYELSQFVGTDKPTYLGDYNGDMAKIDVAIKDVSDLADGIQTTAENALSTANSASSLATTANATATGAAATATSADSRSTLNEGKIEDIYDFISLGTPRVYNSGRLVTGSGTINGVGITVVKSQDGKLAKIYGDFQVTLSSNSSIEVELDTDFEVEEEFTVRPCGMMWATGNNVVRSASTWIKFLTNGKIRLGVDSGLANVRNIAQFLPFLIYVKNFGDTPEEV